MKENFQKSQNQKKSMKRVFNNLKYPIFIGVCLGFFQQFTGIFAILFYSNNVFEKSGSSESLLTLQTFIINISANIAGIVAALIINVFGRKTLLLKCDRVIIFSLFCATLTAYYQFDQFVLVFIVGIFMFSFNMSIGPLTWIMFGDMLPDAGISLCSLSVWFFTSLVGFLFPIANEAFGILFCFAFFLVCTIVG